MDMRRGQGGKRVSRARERGKYNRSEEGRNRERKGVKPAFVGEGMAGIE